MPFIVELFPPGWLGRGFQLLALSLDPGKIVRISWEGVEFRSYEDYRHLVLSAWDVARQLLDEKLVYPPRFFGNDWRPLKNLLGAKVTRWIDAAEQLVAMLRDGRLSADYNQTLTAAMMMKLNMFEYPRRMLGGQQKAAGGSKISIHGYILALIGGLLSKVGRIGDTGFYLVPPPEVGVQDLDPIGSLYLTLVLRWEDGRLNPIGALLGSRGVEKLPASIDTLLILYGSAVIAELLDFEPGAACGASELDLLYAASVTEAGNRAMLNTMFPLGFSEPLCMLGSRPLVELAHALLRTLRGGVCGGGDRDPGYVALGQCVQKLYLYTVTANNIYVYDCARLLRGAAESRECSRSKSLLSGIAASLAQASGTREIVVGG
ncbi:hypothetical protein [Hyperthermus butylicus]|uniref:Uncharacterized protein n=1 Tax=Hyperthermus butylicus (strain DSM 5456 / JCM 9403 / PLM1-5) TaxID=415426 RepID=A2BKI8_HYPBU|nr:hypothetical protein [Hyperthermus butylicus]ABM80499.1 hypothetical protein Hbut_0642 [Hyperthermus butylicus DSM 5456]